MRLMPAKTTSKSATAKASTPAAKAVKAPAKASPKAAAKAAIASTTKPKKASSEATAEVKPVAASQVLPELVISPDEIKLRAYYISERRETMGWPGNSSTDWIEAESQLVAEAKKRLKKML